MAVVAMMATGGSVSYAQPRPLFTIQSGNGDNHLRMDVLAQFDGRSALTDETGAVIDTFSMRRARPILQGRVLRRFEFFLNPDFAHGRAELFDAYVDTVFSRAFRVRVGKAKTPVGLERLINAGTLVFAERSLATKLTANRDIGVQVHGDLAGNTFTYMASVENGAADGANVNTDTNDRKEVAARLVVRPFVRRKDSPLNGLGAGIAGSHGEINELPVLRTATLMQPFLSYAGATADGDRARVSPQAFYYYRSFSTFGEYVRSSQPIRRGAASADIAHTAWNVTASYVLTGDVVTERAVRPRNNFDVGARHIGAVQVAARFHALEVDEQAIALGLAVPGSSRKAQAFTVGVNWYLNPLIKYVLNYERTVFDDEPDGPRQPENGLVFRAQLFF
jgi:phosphate-selective porin OprO/OprP